MFSWWVFFTLLSLVDSRRRNQAEETISFEPQNEVEHSTTNTHIAYDFHFSNCSNASEFLNWNNFCFISNCRNAFNCRLKQLIYCKWFSIAHQMRFVHWRIPAVKTFRGSYFLCVLCSLVSIFKYWINVDKDMLSLKQIE